MFRRYDVIWILIWYKALSKIWRSGVNLYSLSLLSWTQYNLIWSPPPFHHLGLIVPFHIAWSPLFHVPLVILSVMDLSHLQVAFSVTCIPYLFYFSHTHTSILMACCTHHTLHSPSFIHWGYGGHPVDVHYPTGHWLDVQPQSSELGGSPVEIHWHPAGLMGECKVQPKPPRVHSLSQKSSKWARNTLM